MLLSKSLARTGCSKKARCADLTISHAKAAPLAAFLPRDDDTWIKKTLTLSRFNAANFVSSKIHIQLVSMETYTCNQMMTLLIAALSKMININSSYCRLGQFFCNIPLFILICITKLCLIIAALSKVDDSCENTKTI